MDNFSENIWIFHGAQARLASGVFTSKEKAEEWIRKYNLTGVLTEYPLDEGVYDWAIKKDLFTVKKDSQAEPLFIQGFTTASQNHFHYENGQLD